MAGSGGAPVHLAANRASCPPLLMSAPPPRTSGLVRGFGGRTWSTRDRGNVQRSPKKSYVHGAPPGPVEEQNHDPAPRCGPVRVKQSCRSAPGGLAPGVGDQRGPRLATHRKSPVDGGWRKGMRVTVSTPAGATSPWDETLVQLTAWRLKRETSCMVAEGGCIQSRLEERQGSVQR